MGLLIGSGIVVANLGLSSSAGILAYDNAVTFANITSTNALASSPITNVSNPATAYAWEASDTSTQTITITPQTGRTIDYVGIARHNLNQPGLTVQIKFNGAIVLPAQAVSDLQALLFITAEASPTTIEIVISGATEAPKIAVIYAGTALIMERDIYVGHTPMPYGRDRMAVNGMSENGQYLGEIVVSESNSTQVDLQNLTPLWYRNFLDPFFALKPRKPCFWAWRQDTYPDEVGYAWVEGNPRPSNQRSNGMMSMNWTFRGIA